MEKAMKKYYKFPEGIDSGDFFYCYSPQAKAKIQLSRESDCVMCGYNEDTKDYDYLTVITHEKYNLGTEISAECSFEHFGAPLLVITNDTWERDGVKLLGLHFEVVAYESGCNIWRIERDDTTPRGIKPTLMIHDEFKIEDNSRISIKARIEEGKIIANVNGHESVVTGNDIPSEFHVGFTACEGVNRFYNYSIENN